MTRPSVVPRATLPTSSWPSVANESSENPAVGSMRGRTHPRTSATSTTTTTSDVMTKASVKVASGPVARVCERMPSVADGLRVTARAPQRSATPSSAGVVSDRVNGIIGRAMTKNSPVTATRTKTHWIERRPPERPGALAHRGHVELGPAREGDERQRERVDRRQGLHRVLVDELERVRARRDPRDEVAREVWQTERREQLAEERAGQEQEADGRDRPEAALRLGDDARHVEDDAR